MKVALFFLTAFLLKLSGAVIFPPNNQVISNACSLPNTVPAPNGSQPTSIDLPITTDSGTTTIYARPLGNSFIPATGIYPVTVGPPPSTATLPVDASQLSYGVNKTAVGFFTNGATSYLAVLTIEIDCTPSSTLILNPTSTALAVTQGSPLMNIVLNGAIKGIGGLGYATNPINFVMTPDMVSPWLPSGSVQGYPVNTGAVPQNGAQTLTVNVNPMGLPAQPNPYVGFLHIRDQQTGYGAADLTVQLSVSAATTGNATLPHIAVNNTYVTDFSIVNTAAQPANYAINFLDDNGNQLSVLVQGMGVVAGVKGTLPPNGTAYFEAGDPTLATITGGSARIVADASVGVEAAFRLHVQDATGSHYYEASVPATTGSMEFVMPFDLTKFAPTGEQLYTGIAIANMDSANSATISCVATASSGNVIPNAVSVPTLGPNGHWAGFSFQPLLGQRGNLDCTGSTVIGAIGIHAFLVSGAISSLPVFLK
ncbi:MAG TPA: hypothetical protein VKB79_06010 [Bryobacteraceae bacterium]|nr:hypothetical protein [Bryobacteraceae bacterium]